MLVIPAIDIRGGRTVRLLQGDFSREIPYSNDPVAMARQWARLGAPWLHVVDLDGARTGRPAHLELIRRIASAVGIPLQVGGGVRTLEDIEAVLATGAVRVVLGTAAARIAAEAAARYGERVAAAVDVRDSRVAVEGWTTVTARDALTVGQELAARGVRRFIYTAIARDGMLTGPDLEEITAFVGAVAMPVIASGGVASDADLALLAQTGVEGVIVGRALYEGRLDLQAAVTRWGTRDAD